MYKRMIFIKNETYLEDFYILKECSSLVATVIADQLFPTVLLKMVGNIEQKIKEISWQIATFDLEFRRNLLLNKQKDSFTYKEINALYKYAYSTIQNIYPTAKKLSSYGDDIKDNYRYFKLSYLKLKNIFQHINYVSTAYKSLWIDFQYTYSTDISKFLISQKSHKNNSSTQKHTSKKYNSKSKILEDITDKAIKKRHSFAHNTYSYQRGCDSLSKINEANYFTYYFMMIAIDSSLTDLVSILLQSIENNAFFKYSPSI